jgi:2-polyprenyl-3-methyl-5-hydroxy-6-metoxy-1,4-benzoquinol methylase
MPSRRRMRRDWETAWTLRIVEMDELAAVEVVSDIGSASGYKHDQSGHMAHHAYILPALLETLKGLDGKVGGRRLFDLGCGNGAIANVIASHGYDVVGVDASTEGVALARMDYPDLDLHQASVYDDLAGAFGQFDIVVSVEVVEHLYDPRKFAGNLYNLLKPGGYAIVTTPYHGYWKNLAVALTGKFDHHVTALWDHGHIKFWSIPTLTVLLTEAGLVDLQFQRLGRIPPLAKVMLAVGRKPA